MPDQLDEAFEIEERQRQAAILSVMTVTGNERRAIASGARSRRRALCAVLSAGMI